jgi:sigma-B regulation protein RsbU (phosphoserine phosphatase)
MDARILAADDERDILEALELLLKPRGYQVQTVSTPDAVLQALQEQSFDVLLMDLNYARGTTSGDEGIDLLHRVETVDRTLPVVVMTAWSSVEVAVEAMRGRLRDFVQKPWDNDELLAKLEAQIERGRRLRALDREQDEAREIQRRLLPRSLPEPPGYHIASAWRPAHNVSGDYFDVIDLGEDRVALCIGDVSGKGLPAALLMSNVQAAVRVFASSTAAPAEVCAKVNRILCGNLAANKFVTFVYGVLDTRCGRFTYVNAGHNPPILATAAGRVGELRDGGMALGFDADETYAEGHVDLGPGDCLLLFTDGLTEAEDEAEQPFGPERLAERLVAGLDIPVPQQLERIVDEVCAFGSEPLRDDSTALLLARERSTPDPVH